MSGEIMPPSVGVVDLTIKNDAAAEVGIGNVDTDPIARAKMRTLEYLADHGGEVPWSWETIKPETREMVADLIEAHLVVEREYVTHAFQANGRLALRLTDKGRNVVATQRQRKIVASAVKPIG